MCRLPFSRPLRAAHHHRGRIVPIVRVAVAHAAAPVEHRVIQQCPVAFFRRLQLLEEIRELLIWYVAILAYFASFSGSLP